MTQMKQQSSPLKFPQKEINILCIGEVQAGKTFFLQNYCQQQPDELDYQIFVKKVDREVVYLHQLSQEEQVYIDQDFSGVLFFLDIVDSIHAEFNILKWLDLYSKYTGVNIFKIPVRVILTKTKPLTPKELRKQKNRIHKQLSRIVDRMQILFYTPQQMQQTQDFLCDFYNIVQGRRGTEVFYQNCLKVNPYVIWKLYGMCQLLRIVWIQVKIKFSKENQYSLQKIYRRKVDAFKNSALNFSTFYK